MPPRPKIAVLVSNDLATDQRVAKVCAFLQTKNFEITLLGRKQKNSLAIKRSYAVKRFRLLFNKGPLFYMNLNFNLFLYLLRGKFKFIHANDLDTLLAAYLASKVNGAKLVYDTHEYYCGVPELINRPLVRKVWLSIERYIFPKLTHVITVNQSIAGIYKQEYGKDLKVLRNVSPLLEISQDQETNWPFDATNKTILLMQGAGINVERGAEEVVLAMLNLPQCALVFIGDGDVMPKLQQMVEHLQLQHSVFFLGKMPYAKMMKYTAKAHIGLSLDKANSPNYALSLPNKLFDYIQATIPVLASDIKEVKDIIDQFGVGKTINDVSPQKITSAILEMTDNLQDYVALKEKCLIAKKVLCWENEVKVLEEIYP